MRLFAPRTTYRILPDLTASWTVDEGRGYSMGIMTPAAFIAKHSETGQVERTFLDAGTGAEHGAILYYRLPEELPEDASVRMEFLDAQGAVIRTLRAKPADYDAWDDARKSLDTGPWIPTRSGVNRFVWDLRHEGAERVAGNKTAAEALAGPFVLPGEYTVRLHVGEASQSADFEVVNDLRVDVDAADLGAQLELLLRIRDKISDAHRGVNRLRDVRAQVQNWQKRLSEDEAVAEAAESVLGKLAAIEDELILPGEQKNIYGLIQRQRLNAKLASVISVVASADTAPTVQAVELSGEYAAAIDEQLALLEDVVKSDVAALNKLIAQSGAPAIAG